MKLELAAPTLSQARTLVRAYEKQADAVYQQLLCQLLDEKESGHAEDVYKRQEHKRISLSIRALLAPAAEDEEDAE